MKLGSGNSHLARHSDRRKKTRQAEVEAGRQHQGIDRPWVHQVPEGSEEQREMEVQVVKSSVVPQWPSRLRDRWGEVTDARPASQIALSSWLAGWPNTDNYITQTQIFHVSQNNKKNNPKNYVLKCATDFIPKNYVLKYSIAFIYISKNHVLKCPIDSSIKKA